MEYKIPVQALTRGLGVRDGQVKGLAQTWVLVGRFKEAAREMRRLAPIIGRIQCRKQGSHCMGKIMMRKMKMMRRSKRKKKKEKKKLVFGLTSGNNKVASGNAVRVKSEVIGDGYSARRSLLAAHGLDHAPHGIHARALHGIATAGPAEEIRDHLGLDGARLPHGGLVHRVGARHERNRERFGSLKVAVT